MHGVSALKRCALRFRRFTVGRDIRDRSLINLPLVDSIPIVGPLASPLIGNGADDVAQPSTSPVPQPTQTSTNDGNGSGSGSGSDSSGGIIPTFIPSSTSGGETTVALGSPRPSGSPVSEGSQPFTGQSGSPGPPASTGSGSSFPEFGPGGPSASQSASDTSNGATTVPRTTMPAALETGFPSPSQGSNSNIVGPAPSSSPASTAMAASTKQFPGGAIAGITVVCLFSLLALILLLVRRRFIARRIELRKHWWFSRDALGGSFPLISNISSRSRVGPHGATPASRSSSRSSFATNFDQGLMFHADSPSRLYSGAVPDLPPMAEVRDHNAALISTGSAVARRESMNSMLSNGSEPDGNAQYLSIPTGQNNVEPFTHLSVRPFSPSESFAFPKPPCPLTPTPDSFFISKTQETRTSQSSTATLVHISTPPRAFMTDLPPTLVYTPYLRPETSTPSLAISPLIASSDPFADPFIDAEKPEHAGVDIIHRAFTPSLDDELAVRLGDHVRLIRVYDDGWVFVERLTGAEGGHQERGLIPIDCLCNASQTLPTNLSPKRASSYSDYGPGELVAGTAL